MKLKDPWRFSDWVFYYQTLDTPPQEGRIVGSSEEDLLMKVRKQLNAIGVTPPPDLKEIIQHQICLRQADPKSLCWNSGVGDKLHHDWMKPFLTKVALTVEQSTKNSIMIKVGQKVAKGLRKIAACTTCGGTTTYLPNENNRGRAGSLNDFLR